MTDKRRIDYFDWLCAVNELAGKYDLTERQTAEVLIDCALSIGCDDYRGLALYFAGQVRQIGEFDEEHPVPDEHWSVVVEYDNRGPGGCRRKALERTDGIAEVAP